VNRKPACHRSRRGRGEAEPNSQIASKAPIPNRNAVGKDSRVPRKSGLHGKSQTSQGPPGLTLASQQRAWRKKRFRDDASREVLVFKGGGLVEKKERPQRGRGSSLEDRGKGPRKKPIKVGKKIQSRSEKQTTLKPVGEFLMVQVVRGSQEIPAPGGKGSGAAQ